ncbi:family 20 glycosylhydrolase [Actinopolymorpha rutila]|uniref:beta-N-acetylhexosaminidase n=1 Tax=Actinopolymorpha rutila TaxID=446787 RepID=A0A852ZCH1_9ACTN|nr:hexosaminidase [Actinopolymorpha rutila]
MIPWPTSYLPGQGSFTLDDATVVEGPPALSEIWRTDLGALAARTPATGDGCSRVDLDLDAGLPAEGYHLEVRPEVVRIRGGSPAGVFYAVQTLRQLLPPDSLRRAAVGPALTTVPCCVVEDAPAHGWRGGLLDVARHFVPKEFVLRYVDLLALHKLNVLQLHLTDNDGWRFESRKYPRLTEVGGWRPETRWVWEESGDGTPHGGFYSRADLAEIVAYAASRFVTIVPEIEMPAHTFAAIAAYPELGNDPDLAPQTCVPSTGHDVVNVEESTVTVFTDVLAEVLEVFPSPFVHIGGDECPKEPWRNSPRAQARMRELGLADEDALQSWFVRRMDDWLSAHGRRLVGWDEILEGGLASGATVMSWRGESGGVTAARAGHDVVMAPTDPTYFDYYQSDQDDEPLTIGGLNTLESVYAYEPVPAELTGPEAKHVLGAQFQLWGEFQPNGASVEYMTFPRACAFAEAVWRERRTRSYEEFRDRLVAHLPRLDALGVNYRPLDGPRPWQRGGRGRFNRPSQPQMVD